MRERQRERERERERERQSDMLMTLPAPQQSDSVIQTLREKMHLKVEPEKLWVLEMEPF